jgi:hypothetical protein
MGGGVRVPKVWAYTIFKAPIMQMGGEPWFPAKTLVEASEKFPLGQGYFGHLLVSPRGKTFVVESKSHALVGPTPDVVIKDVKEGDPAMMKKQVTSACAQFKKAREVSIEEWWRRLDK